LSLLRSPLRRLRSLFLLFLMDLLGLFDLRLGGRLHCDLRGLLDLGFRDWLRLWGNDLLRDTV
jgi:hypothetical protein